MTAAVPQVWDLLDDYIASAGYGRLAPSTKAEYRRVVDAIGTEIGHLNPIQMTRAQVRAMRDRWSIRGHRAASIRLQILKNAFQPLIEDEVLPITLFTHLTRVRGPGHGVEPHPVWKASEFEAFIEEAAHLPGLVRAAGLARYGGFRREDLCRLPNSAREHRGGQIRYRWRTGKSEAAIEHLEDPRLSWLLDQATSPRGPTIAYNRNGEAWQPRQLSQALQRVLIRLAKRDKVRTGLTWHGLRHTRGVELAEAGCSDAIIMAQLGHTTDRSAQIYRRQASRRRLGDAGQSLVNRLTSWAPPTGAGDLPGSSQAD